MELRHSFYPGVPIMMVTHIVKGKIEMRVLGSLLESGVELSGMSKLVARYRRMDKCLRYPEIRRGS